MEEGEEVAVASGLPGQQQVVQEGMGRQVIQVSGRCEEQSLG